MAFGGYAEDNECARWVAPESGEMRDISASFCLTGVLQQSVAQFERDTLIRARQWTPRDELKFRLHQEQVASGVAQRLALLTVFWECPSCGAKPGREFLIDTGWMGEESFADLHKVPVPKDMPEQVMEVATILVLSHGRHDTAEWLEKSGYQAKLARPAQDIPESVDDLPPEFRLKDLDES